MKTANATLYHSKNDGFTTYMVAIVKPNGVPRTFKRTNSDAKTALDQILEDAQVFAEINNFELQFNEATK